MSERNQFFGQPRNNTLGASIELGRNGLGQRGYLRDLHLIILAGIPTGLCRLPLQRLAFRAGTEPDGTRAAIANLPVRQRETDRGLSEKRKLSTPRAAGLPPQVEARGGRPLPSHSPLVPGCFKALQ